MIIITLITIHFKVKYYTTITVALFRSWHGHLQGLMVNGSQHLLVFWGDRNGQWSETCRFSSGAQRREDSPKGKIKRGQGVKAFIPTHIVSIIVASCWTLKSQSIISERFVQGFDCFSVVGYKSKEKTEWIGTPRPPFYPTCIPLGNDQWPCTDKLIFSCWCYLLKCF